MRVSSGFSGGADVDLTEECLAHSGEETLCDHGGRAELADVLLETLDLGLRREIGFDGILHPTHDLNLVAFSDPTLIGEHRFLALSGRQRLRFLPFRLLRRSILLACHCEQ